LLRAEPGVQLSLQPRPDCVPGLIERARKSGLRAGLVVDGEDRPLAGAIELAGYCIVQEALTKAIRHAGSTAATVRPGYSRAGVLIEVTDQGPQARPGASAAQHDGLGPACPLVSRSSRITGLARTPEPISAKVSGSPG
jgi:signal transduction histidine kinase